MNRPFFSLKGFSSATQLLGALSVRSEQYWLKRGEDMALRLFHEAALRVPAYKDFLRRHKIKPEKIKTITDFKLVPPVDKKDYLKAYSLEDLCWDGKLKQKSWVFSSTSGTTGEPFYFPRTDEQDMQYAWTAEMYLLTNFQIHKRSTLYVNGFAMGPWIGGVFTYQALKHIASSGQYSLSIVTPGTNKMEIIKAISKIGSKFDQVIIGGYPPFVKDTIDEGILHGLDWRKYKLGFVFSAEGFTESFRDYIAKSTGLADIYRGTLNHYGTVDLGTMSHETPICVLVRRIAASNSHISESIFSVSNRQPTLTQYLPEMFYFEEEKGNLICSAYSGLPLVRYDLKDVGGVITFGVLKEKLPRLDREVRSAGIGDTVWNLPFVYVFERSDMVVSWYGANIYPEHIREAHNDVRLQKYLSGRFTMTMVYDRKHNPILEIHSELKKDVKGNSRLIKQLQKIVIDTLLKKNSEYSIIRNSLAEKRTRPKIYLHPHGTEKYFKTTNKQRWLIK